MSRDAFELELDHVDFGLHVPVALVDDASIVSHDGVGFFCVLACVLVVHVGAINVDVDVSHVVND